MAMPYKPGGRHMKFQIGDAVQVGARIGTITDVGTVLIQFKTNEGLRVACPWEVVKIPWLPLRVSRVAVRDGSRGGDHTANTASQLVAVTTGTDLEVIE
jgi:hypothetical protein